MKAKKLLLFFILFAALSFVQRAPCDTALDAKVNTVSSWCTVPHPWNASCTFNMSPITVDTETTPDSSLAMESKIDTTPDTQSPYYYGYGELRWTSPDATIDFTNYDEMDFWYKIEVSSGTVNGFFCHMYDEGWTNCVALPAVIWIQDGKWHQMKWPLRPADMTNVIGKWTWNVTAVQICLGPFYAEVAGQKKNIDIKFGGFHFVPK